MRSKKTYSTVNVDKMLDYIKRNRISTAAFAFKIGVSHSCVANWIKNGAMPQYMGVMLDALNSTVEPQPQPKTDVSAFIVSGKPEAVEALMATALVMQLQTMRLEI